MAIYTVSSDVIDATRSALVSALRERKNHEVKTHTDATKLASILKYLDTQISVASNLDAYALAFLATHPVDFSGMFLSHRRVTDCFNVYAIPKSFAIARCLNGSTFDLHEAAEETIVAVVLAIAKGVYWQHDLNNAVDFFMIRPGNGNGRGEQKGGDRITYSSGATQASSALRALEALGVVQSGAGRGWHVADEARFNRLLDAANGIVATASDSVTIDGEFELVPEMLALASASSVTDEEVASAQLALTGPAPLLALPAPAKAKRASKRKSK